MLPYLRAMEIKETMWYNFDEMNSIDSLEFTPATVETLNGKTIEFTQPLTADDTTKKSRSKSTSVTP